MNTEKAALTSEKESEIQEEFTEIAHSGGQIIMHFVTTPEGVRGYQLTWQHQRSNGGGFFAIYALAPGYPVGDAPLGGLGSTIPPSPVPGAMLVFVASDSESMYGRRCPACLGYWRSTALSPFCVCCGGQAPSYAFITEAQSIYIQQYCELFAKGLHSQVDGKYVIDLDAVADAVKDIEKPPFYYSEERQQSKYTCNECATSNDVLGRFGYCAQCGTRNDFQELETKIMADLRNRIDAGGSCESVVKETVSAFDTLVSQYVKEALRRVPMTEARRNRLDGKRFHNLSAISLALREALDWELLRGINEEDRTFASLMFHRRPIYEHNGGEADQRYLDQSGDTTVRLKQLVKETRQSAHRIIGVCLRMARNVHTGFHDIFPPDPTYIRLQKRN